MPAWLWYLYWKGLKEVEEPVAGKRSRTGVGTGVSGQKSEMGKAPDFEKFGFCQNSWCRGGNIPRVGFSV